MGVPPRTVVVFSQGVWSAPALAVGNGFTVTVRLSAATQPTLSVKVAVYVVVTTGDATGLGW